MTTAPKCEACGNDGTQGALYVTVDAKWLPDKKAWVLEARENDGGQELDCLACDHHTPSPEFPYGAEIAA